MALHAMHTTDTREMKSVLSSTREATKLKRKRKGKIKGSNPVMVFGPTKAK